MASAGHSPPSARPLPKVIDGHLIVARVLGAGNFGCVCEAVDENTGGVAAVKLEDEECDCPQLAIEDCVLSETTDKGLEGFPYRYGFGHQDGFLYLVMQRLGRSVEDLRAAAPEGRLSLPVVVGIARQALSRLQNMHELGYVHRDIKPQNFLFGVGDKAGVLYLIDFGLCKRVVDPGTREHCPVKKDKGLTGTPRYVSLATHMGYEQSFRDDIEALGYMLLYLHLGALPWQSLHNNREIHAKKMTTGLDLLCGGLPGAFRTTIEYARGMQYGTMPDYVNLRKHWDDGAVFAGRARRPAEDRRSATGPAVRPHIPGKPEAGTAPVTSRK